MIKRLEWEIRKNFPNVTKSKTELFYEANFEHIVSGFAFETTPTFYRFHYSLHPLYDLSTPTQLTYSEKLFDVVKTDIKKDDVISMAMDHISRETTEHRLPFQINDFMEIIEKRIRNIPQYLKNPPHRKTYANTLIMMGKFEEAEKELLTLKNTYVYEAPNLVNDLNGTLESLKQGQEAALSFRTHIEKIMRKRIGLKQ